MEHIQGRWVMDKTRSTSVDAILKLQGISWPLRKTLSLVTMYLDISMYPDDDDTATKTNDAGAGTRARATVIDVYQTATGGLKGTRERRVLDWSVQKHWDYVFGSATHETGFLEGKADGQGNVYPDVEMRTTIPGDDEGAKEKAKRFLRGEIREDGSGSTWFIPDRAQGASEGSKGVWVQTFVQSVPARWTVEQVWGFEQVDGHLYHSRRLVAVNAKGELVLGRLLYRLLEDRSGIHEGSV
ncbi:uncharacterized protein BJX67DRAFT_320944 [Aspergillus lucknowensis]|uniref:Uncharacterized protein n=1 Tax=Aspergillus lucknowensis TaxID=176173 RepID=A0ABR4LYZ3_9EURO